MVVDFIFATLITIFVTTDTEGGISVLFIHAAIMVFWFPLMFVAFVMLIRDYLTDLEKAGDDQ